MNRSSPEIVKKNVRYWCLRPQVSVFFNGTYVVEDETAVQAVVINYDAS